MTSSEHQLVHQAIQAIAAHCDGARALDNQGFDGQDTHYGRRIAAVPFELLTEDDYVEEARLAHKYQAQAERYGVPVAHLDVVQKAQGTKTNHVSRENARRHEKASRAAHLKDERKAVLRPDGKIGITWARKDPDFGLLLDAAKALPGRSFDWDCSQNVIPVQPELAEFLAEWDIEATPEVHAALEVAATAEPAEVVAGNVFVQNGQLIVSKPGYDAAYVAEARCVPGRRWTGKHDVVTPSPSVIDFAHRWNLAVTPEALALCEEAAIAEADEAARKETVASRGELLSRVSALKDPADLPEAFLQLVDQARAR